MKTTALGSKLARLHSGIGAAIASLAAARGLDKAVAELAFDDAQRRGRSRIPGPKRPAGSKLARKAAEGRITHRHSV